MSSIASRREARRTKQVNYNETSMWKKSLKQSSSNSENESDDSSSEDYSKYAVRDPMETRKSTKEVNYKDYSSSELESEAYYSSSDDENPKKVRNEELSESELSDSDNEENEYDNDEEEDEEDQYAVQAILGVRDEFKLHGELNKQNQEKETEENEKDKNEKEDDNEEV